MRRFLYATPSKYEAAESDAKLAAVVISVNKSTGKATSIRKNFISHHSK